MRVRVEDVGAPLVGARLLAIEIARLKQGAHKGRPYSTPRC